MPAYDAEKYIGAAIESILRQTFFDFELIVVDDGSGDRTASIAAEYAERDERAVLLRQAHAGVRSAANAAIQAARGEFVARMDADDVSAPQRLECQVAHLRRNQGVGVVGSNAEEFDSDGRIVAFWNRPNAPEVIRWFLLFGCCFAHSSVLMRANLLERIGRYRIDYGEDYDLFLRAATITELAILPQTLVKIRVLENSYSHRTLGAQLDAAVRLQSAVMSELLGEPVSERSIEIFRRSTEGIVEASGDDFEAAADLLVRLHRAYLLRYAPAHADRAEIAFNMFQRFARLAASARIAAPALATRLGARGLSFTAGAFSLRNLKRAAARCVS